LEIDHSLVNLKSFSKTIRCVKITYQVSSCCLSISCNLNATSWSDNCEIASSFSLSRFLILSLLVFPPYFVYLHLVFLIELQVGINFTKYLCLLWVFLSSICGTRMSYEPCHPNGNR